MMAGKNQKSEGAKTHPLEGLRVLDLGIGAVGVEVGRLFAEYGADVIKVETTASLDFIRGIMGGVMNPPFASSNRTKRSFGINLKTKQGQKLMDRLVKSTDVIIENSAPGVMERIGLGYERVRKLNPRTVMISSQLLGKTGAWSHWVGYGPSTHPVSGLSYLWNFPEDSDRPSGSQNIYPDHLIGRLGALLAVAGLIQRERTGKGAHGEIAQFEVPIGLMGDLFLQESLQAGSAVPRGNRSQRGAPWGAYRCKGEDSWCVINVRSDDEWDRLRAVLGNPAWARSKRYRTAQDRLSHQDELDGRISKWTGSRTSRQVMTMLQRRGIPAGMVQHPRDQTEDPHLAKRGFLRPIRQYPIGRIILEGPAFHSTRIAEPIIRPAPELGEHNQEICVGFLKMSKREVKELMAKGILEMSQEAKEKAKKRGK